jgi:hypothetical protein
MDVCVPARQQRSKVAEHVHRRSELRGLAALQWYHSGVTVVLQWCYNNVTVVLQWCYSGVTVVLKHSYRAGLTPSALQDSG